jgi:hypothetical protein
MLYTIEKGRLFFWRSYYRAVSHPGEQTVLVQFNESGERVTQGTRVRVRKDCYIKTVTLPVFDGSRDKDGRRIPIAIQWGDPKNGCSYRVINFYAQVPLREQFYFVDVLEKIVARGFASFSEWIEDVILCAAERAGLTEQVLLPFSSEHHDLARLFVELLAFFGDLELPRHELLSNINPHAVHYRAVLGGEGPGFSIEGVTT